MFLIHRKYNNRNAASKLYDDMLLWLLENLRLSVGASGLEIYSTKFQNMVLPHLDVPDVNWHLSMSGYQGQTWWLCYYTYYDPIIKDGFYCITANVPDEYVALEMMLTI